MKQHVSKGMRVGLSVLICTLFGACSVIETVSDGVGSTVEGVTKIVSSTTPDEKSAAFVETRFASIRSEAARGEGENLDSLAKLLGENDRTDFARFMKDRYADLFVGLEQPRELLARIANYRGRQPG